MFDLHGYRNLLPVVHNGQEYHGGVDGGIAPFGLLESSAATQLIVVYIHKQSDNQKQRYLDKHGDKAQVCMYVLADHSCSMVQSLVFHLADCVCTL